MKVGILGFGNVAAATIDSFIANQDLIRSKTRAPIEFVHIATRTPSRAQGRVPAGCIVNDDCLGLVDDPQIDVVLELMGNVKLGRELVLRALSNRKHVITANKALLARHGEEIMERADDVGCSVLFEGAVAVSIPIIKTLRESMAANRISSIIGILNGTSNYVLSQMSEHCVNFATAVADAQRKGYAEADPTLDVSGEDAAHKLALLASLAFGAPINFGAVAFKGITDVDQTDLEVSGQLGYQIKLIAQARRGPEGMSISVQPTLVPNRSMLAQVSGSMNGIAIQGDLLGTAFLYGAGAGGRQTSSAVLADLIELANRGNLKKSEGAHNMGFSSLDSLQAEVCYCKDPIGTFYIRIGLDDKADTLSKVSTVLVDGNVSIKAQHQNRGHGALSDLIVITHDTQSEQLRQILSDLQKAAGRDQPPVIYPVLGDCGC